jgi:hypothetical protein
VVAAHAPEGAELSLGVAALAVEPEVVFVAEPEVGPEAVSVAVESAVAPEGAELSLEAAALAVEPEVVFVAEPEVVLAVAPVSPVSVAGFAVHQVSDNIAVASVVANPVSLGATWADSPGHPTFVGSSPNTCSFPSSSSSVELGYKVLVYNPTDARTSYGLCSVLSNAGLHHNRNSEHYDNNPSLCRSNVNDTNGLPIDATTNHSRKTGLYLCKDQHRYRCQAALPVPAVRRRRWVVVTQY